MLINIDWIVWGVFSHLISGRMEFKTIKTGKKETRIGEGREINARSSKPVLNYAEQYMFYIGSQVSNLIRLVFCIKIVLFAVLNTTYNSKNCHINIYNLWPIYYAVRGFKLTHLTVICSFYKFTVYVVFPPLFRNILWWR